MEGYTARIPSSGGAGRGTIYATWPPRNRERTGHIEQGVHPGFPQDQDVKSPPQGHAETTYWGQVARTGLESDLARVEIVLIGARVGDTRLIDNHPLIPQEFDSA